MSTKEHSWIERIFRAAQANKGGVVRRSCASVEKITTFARLKAAADARGFRVFRVAEQYIISCRPELIIDVA
ncbi:hypothetical protein [Haliangium sp. UPWRP_2]|uniref:hypothetical protein n=1 Tax=Haliangium sp. UPWRP_2 TaxID=1931276 RepID=UPI000B53EB65|nr:hypothetical protein [Haliangium sp. UPWRP_2]